MTWLRGYEVPEESVQRIKEVAETWDVLRRTGRSFDIKDMRKFIETMNDRTKQIIREVHIEDVQWYQELARVANDAAVWLAWNPSDPPPLGEWQMDDAKEFITTFRVTHDANFYSAISELCVNAQTQLTKGARLIADGIDRTNV